MPMVTKLFRVVTCGKELSPINMHDISMKWSCWVMWQIKYIYQHHNRQGADTVLEAPKYDPLIKWPTWGHVIVWKIYISIFTRFIAYTLGRIFIAQMLSHHQLLVIIELVTFLWIGITFAILNIFGNTPWLKYIFIISLKGFENSFLNSFKILIDILFGSLALFVFIELIRSSAYSGTGGERKNVFLFSGPRYERWVFFTLTMFVYFFSNTCKKNFKVVRNLFGTGY